MEENLEKEANNYEQQAKDLENRAWEYLWKAAFVIVFFFICSYALNRLAQEPIVKTLATAGTFGDFIGGILNPAVSLVAAILFFSSLKMQRSDLRMTRIDLSRQAKLLDDQRTELSNQHKAMTMQLKQMEISSENNIFKFFIENLDDILKSSKTTLKIGSKDGKIEKKDISGATSYGTYRVLFDMIIDNDGERLGDTIVNVHEEEKYFKILSDVVTWSDSKHSEDVFRLILGGKYRRPADEIRWGLDRILNSKEMSSNPCGELKVRKMADRIYDIYVKYNNVFKFYKIDFDEVEVDRIIKNIEPLEDQKKKETDYKKENV